MESKFNFKQNGHAISKFEFLNAKEKFVLDAFYVNGFTISEISKSTQSSSKKIEDILKTAVFKCNDSLVPICLEMLSFSKRIEDLFNRLGINNISQFLDIDLDNLLKEKGIGRKTLNELKSARQIIMNNKNK